MSESRHTPGPWRVRPGKNSDGEETLFIESDRESIATMDVVSVNGGPFVLPPRAWANARLIAAAPDLLAALILCERALEERDAEAEGHAAKEARYIISKAKGE